MKTEIYIDCEDERELLIHLSVIRQNVKKSFRKLEKEPEHDVIKFTDANCYGHHIVNISFID